MLPDYMTSELWGKMCKLYPPGTDPEKRLSGRLFFWCLGGIPGLVLAVLALAFLFLLHWAAGAVAAVFVAWECGRFFFRRAPKPYGVRLDRATFADAYRQVNDLAHQLRAPRIDDIYITGDINASVQEKYLFRPGFNRCVLSLGHPFLCALTRRGLNGILAHELGHLSRRHTWRGMLLIYYIQFWEQQNWVTGIFGHFWRGPFLRNMTLLYPPFSRVAEREADRFAAEAVGQGAFAEGLSQLEVCQRNQAETMAPLLDAVILHGEWETADFCAIIEGALGTPPEKERIKRLLHEAMTEPTLPCDSHPALRERIAAQHPEELADKPGNALRKFLPNIDVLRKELNEQYRTAGASGVPGRIARMEEAELVLAEPFDPATADIPAAIRRVDALEIVADNNKTLELTRILTERFPEAAGLLIPGALAEFRENPDSEQGAAQMTLALEKDPLLAIQGEPYCRFLLRRNDWKGVGLLLKRKEAAGRYINRIFPGSLNAESKLIPWGVPPRFLESLRERLGKQKVIRRAFAVKLCLDNSGYGYWLLVLIDCGMCTDIVRVFNGFILPEDPFMTIPFSTGQYKEQLSTVPSAEFYKR